MWEQSNTRLTCKPNVSIKNHWNSLIFLTYIYAKFITVRMGPFKTIEINILSIIYMFLVWMWKSVLRALCSIGSDTACQIKVHVHWIWTTKVRYLDFLASLGLGECEVEGGDHLQTFLLAHLPDHVIRDVPHTPCSAILARHWNTHIRGDGTMTNGFVGW